MMPLHFFENFLCPFDDFWGESRHLSHMDSKTVLASAWHQFSQKYNPVVHFFGRYVVIADAWIEFFELVEFVVMGGEQGFWVIRGVLVEVFGHGPGDRDTVVSAGAAADFVEQDEAPGRKIVDDVRRFDHFHHKSRFPFG